MNPQIPADQNPSNQPVPSAASAPADTPSPEASKPESAAPAATQSLSDGGARLAAQFEHGKTDALLRTAYAGVLTLVAISAACAVGAAYLPISRIAGTEPDIQVAAVAETTPQPVDPFEGLTLGARAAYVYDAETNKELYARNPHLQLPPASISKIALMLAVSEVLEPDTMVTISDFALERGGGGLNLGEIWRTRDLIDFTLITSSNAGAEALAETADAKLRAKYPAAPADRTTVWRMNKIAEELGMKETYFINATGLDESPTQAGSFSSAKDIATLFTHAIRTNPTLFAGTKRSNATLAPLNFPERVATNTNNALADIPGLIMGKTGTTDLAGGNLAIVFNAAIGHPVVIVVLGSTESGRYDDMRALVETAKKAI